MELEYESVTFRRGLLNKWESPLTGTFVSSRVSVLHQYQKDGWLGTFDKGELLFTLLKCMAFKEIPLSAYLYETSDDYSARKGELKRKNPFMYFDINIFRDSHLAAWRKKGWGTINERIDDIKKIDEETIRKNAELIITNSPTVKDEYRGKRKHYADYSPEMIVGLAKCIDRNTLVRLAEKLADKKFSYNFSFGYPDILVFKGVKVKFIKVNATVRDNIWETQAFNFENLLLPLGFNISVCQVVPDTVFELPEDLMSEDQESLKRRFEEAILQGDFSTIKDIYDNVNSIQSLGFDDSAIVSILVNYLNSSNCSVSAVEQFISKLLVTDMSRDAFNSLFFLHFSRPNKKSNRNLTKKLLQMFLKLGIDSALLTSVLCKYINKYGWDGDLKYFDETYVEFLLENGADPNIDVSDEPHENSYVTNAITAACDLQFESSSTAYSVLKILTNYGGDIRPAIESWHLEGQLLRLRLKGFDFELKPNHIGRDGETDVTRELKALMYDDLSNVINTLLMLKDAGANFTVANADGDTPLHVVVKIDNEDDAVIKYLLDEGVDLTLENSYQRTPLIELITSINRKDKETLDRVKSRLDLLIENGDSVCQTTTGGLTVFHVAADEAPQLLPHLRKYIAREPDNIVEAILFNGNKAVISLDDYLKHATSKDKIIGLSFAISIRAEKLVDKLLLNDINIITAAEKFRDLTQKNTRHHTYSLILLKFLAKIKNEK